MTKLQKLKAKFLRNPKSIKYTELELILKYLGFEKIKAKGSHVKFKHSKLTVDIIIPIHNGECKDFYKKQTKKIVENI